MPSNYVLLRKTTLTTSTASVTFSDIPSSGYTDLKIVSSVRTDRSGTVDGIKIRFNSDTTVGNYSERRVFGDGSSVTTGTEYLFCGYATGATATSNTFGNSECYIPNYTSSNQKSVSVDSVTENNATQSYALFDNGKWTGTNAIAIITMSPDVGSNFLANSEFALYGIAAVGVTPATAPFATGGDIVANDGTYWYHAFLSSGTFVPGKALTCDALVVAGGGGGGSILGGGGGAGGVLAFSSQALTASTIYAATIGSGGSGATNYLSGYDGGNSKFGALTTCVGGGGGSGNNFVGRNGGSGGGGRDTYAGGTATSGQGNNGAAGGSVSQTGAGGGGKGSAGSSGTGAKGGDGGAGTNSVTNWGALSSVFSTTGLGVSGYIAGGGGGGKSFNGATSTARGLGGSGGGGDGGWTNSGASSDNTAIAGVVNTGSGGGGAPNNYAGETTLTAGKNGGSGLIIIRYPMV